MVGRPLELPLKGRPEEGAAGSSKALLDVALTALLVAKVCFLQGDDAVPTLTHKRARSLGPSGVRGGRAARIAASGGPNALLSAPVAAVRVDALKATPR